MQQQQQFQGTELRHRQSQTQYQGEDRRKPERLYEEPAGDPGSGHPGMSAQERKDDQQEKAQQQEKDRNKL